MRPTSELIRLGASELSGLVRRREVSALEIARAHLDRVTETEPRIRAFLSLRAEKALEVARRVDQRVAAGEDLPLAGVPVAIKDVMHVEGEATTCGSRILEAYVAPYTATAVSRLEQAGAVVLGKTNMDEFAMGSSTENSAYHPTANPWDLSRVPGGSSGGSAASVAARQAPLTLGSDTGGSIRQPAALCGVVGLKPTYGRVSRYGLVAFASSLDQIGPLTRSVEDSALAAQVLFGRDAHDSTSAAEAVPDFGPALCSGVRGVRIGVPEAFISKGLDPQVEQLFRAALAELKREGAELVSVDLPHAPHAIATYYLVATAEASSNLARYDGVRYGLRKAAPDLKRQYGETRDQGFGAEVKRRIILGTFVLSSGYYDAYYRRAQQLRTLIRHDFEKAFASCDVIATPTAPTPAFRFGEKTDDPLQMYLADVFTVPANLAGLPGISLPCGLASGLPAGLQLVGRAFDEATLFRLGAAYQKVTRHHEAAPGL